MKRLALGVVLAAMASVMTAVGPGEARERNVAILIFPGVQITRLDRPDAAGAAESRWRLRDGDGSAWTEATRVEQVRAEKGYRVTVTVVRAAAG